MKIFSNKQINRIASTSYGINYQVIASICSMEDIYSEHATLEEAIDSAERAQQSFMNVKIKDVATGECWLDIEDAKYDLYNGFVESTTSTEVKSASRVFAADKDAESESQRIDRFGADEEIAIDGFDLYICGERNYEGVHYYIVKDVRDRQFRIGDVLKLSDWLGYRIEYMYDSMLWVAAPKQDRDKLSNRLSEANRSRILGSQSFSEPYDPYLLDELINYYSMQDTMNLSDIWDEIVDQYGDESLANDVIESIDDYDSVESATTFKTDKRLSPIAAVKSSNDSYDPYSFMVGDQLEWSGLYGDQYKGIVTNVDDEYVTVEVMWTSEDSGDTIIDTQKFEIATDPDGKECIIVWTYGSDAGYVYPQYDGTIDFIPPMDDEY